MAAPIRPPNSAWEDDEGSPNSHVIRFQTMPPTRPAKMITRTGTPIKSGSGAPLAL